PAARLVEVLLSLRHVAEHEVCRCSGVSFAQALFPQAFGLQLYVGFDFSAEVARIPLASEHGLALLGLQNAPDRGRQSIPLGGFFYELLAAGRCQRIKPRLAVICGDSPFRGNPAALLKPLERGVKRSVLHQKLLIRRLLDRARDPLAVLRSKNQRAQDQQIQGALQQFQPFSCFLGRHTTRAYECLGKMSTQKSERSRRQFGRRVWTLADVPLSALAPNWLRFLRNMSAHMSELFRGRRLFAALQSRPPTEVPMK